MNQIVLDEKQYAEECLRGDCSGKSKVQSISILAKYYYHVLGYRKKKIIQLLTEYVEKNNWMRSGERIYWETMIEKCAVSAGKHKLYEISGVKITKNEMATIQDIKGKKLQRLAFTMLCLAKLGNLKNENNNSWVVIDSKDIFKLARITCKSIDRDIMIGELYQLGLLEFSKRNDNLSCRVKYIDDNSDEVLFITDFRELGYEYLKYCGGHFTRCAECGILMRNDGKNAKKYCSRCAAPKPMVTKKVVCIDCGQVFETSSKNNESKRCPYCYSIYRREYKRNAAWTARNRK